MRHRYCSLRLSQRGPLNDRRTVAASDELRRVHENLLQHGYAVTSDEAIGLPEKFRENFAQTYFVDGVIRHDEGDYPIDRKRARDVVHYWWHGDKVRLEEYETITITDRAGIKGKRDHARVELLADPQAREFVETLLRFMPFPLRKPEGTFGVNLFRTFTNVVSKPHRDHEEFVYIYVLDRVGEGARTHLYTPESVTEDGRVTAAPILDQQLQPGDIIVFDDKRYKHDASPLESPLGGQAMRDALICTIDSDETYLKA